MDASSRIVETHISTLVFVGDRVYKRKRPLRTGFVDFTTREARAAACREEVELNRRLAPDVYLGVAEVSLDRLDGSGEVEAVDDVVVMRRLPEDRRLSALLDTAGAPNELHRLAELIAGFHAGARRGPDVDAVSGADGVAELWEDGIGQLADVAEGVLDAEVVDRVADLARRYVAGRRPLLDGRVADRRAVDGHGDLQAGDVFCLDDGPRVLDCLEFSERYRFGDALADVAFLAMDLERLGRPDLARAFLDEHRSLTDDDWPESLAHLWIAYRAHVRAKVTCISVHQLEEAGDAEFAAVAARDARVLLDLAARHLHAGRVRLVVLGGGPGTGKSTVAARLGERLDAVVVSSDRVRDELVPRSGERRGDEPGQGRYAPERIEAVYDELLRRAGVALAGGASVVADASWLDARRRRRARALAADLDADVVELRCTCPPELAEERIRSRAAKGADPSEATIPVARAMAGTSGPWPGAIDLDTTAPVEDAVARAVEVVRSVRSPS